MAIEREVFLKILEDSFSAYYDIVPQDHPELPMVFRGDYKKVDEKYWIVKSLPIWSNETGEYCYVFSSDRFSPDLVKACTDFALKDGLPRVKPHKDHQHTDIKVVFIADSTDEETRRAVKKQSFSKSYHFSFWGFSNLLTAIVDLQEGKSYTNKAGYALEKYFRKLFDIRKEEG